MRYLNFLAPVLIAFSQFSSAQTTAPINSGEVIKHAAALYDSAKYHDGLKLLDGVNRSDTNYVWSLYERAIDYEADSDYTKAIACCKEGLALNEQREYEPELYNTYGNTLLDLNKPEEALKIFDKAIAKYPAYSLFYFNKGVGYMAMKQYAEAEKVFQQTLLVNPYQYSAHFQLGLAALQQGKIVPAYLCFTGYLVMNPSGKYLSQCIKMLDAISKNTDEIANIKNARTVNPDENYQGVEDILFSKIALDKAYKPKASIDDPISRQIQAVIEKLDYSDASTDFYIQYYLPFYKQVYNDGKFEPFIFHVFSQINIPVIQEYNKKNKKDLQSFVDEAVVYFDGIRQSRELTYPKRAGVIDRYLYEDGKLVGKGPFSPDGKLPVGKWTIYHPAGNLRGYGLYNNAGKKDGDWIYYGQNGVMDAKEHLVNGLRQGEQLYYFDNSNLSSKENYVNDKAEGLVTSYYYAGGVSQLDHYKAGKKDGESKEYYADGRLRSEAHYVNGKLSGTSREYYKNGHLKSQEEFLNGNGEGSYSSFYENGAKDTEGALTKDKTTGEWKYYYKSGQLKEKRTYADDEENGVHQEFFENGQLSVTYNIKKGKIDGDEDYFYKDGKPYEKYVHKDGAIVSGVFYDNDGRQTSIVRLATNGTFVTTHQLDGYVRSHSFFNSNSELEGVDTLFLPSGRIDEINTYKNGVLNGSVTHWYKNGKKKSEVTMADGKDNGYEVTYYIDGTKESEGWNTDGSSDGEWVEYDELGRVSTTSYYAGGALDGYKDTFTPNGKLLTEEKYRKGWLQKITQFDTLRNVIHVDSFPKGSGAYTLIYPGGKTMISTGFVNGNLDGLYQTFYFDGSLESKGFYSEGLLDSTYTAYYFGGVKQAEGRYHLGSKEGLWKYYNEDGNIDVTSEFKDDDLNGLKTYYFDNGLKNYVAEYKDDESNGTDRRYAPDGSVAYQISFENDKALAYTYAGRDGHNVAEIALTPANQWLKAYFPTGEPARTCRYVDGVKDGADSVYFSPGHLHYVDSTMYGVSFGFSRQYYPNGKLRSQYRYRNDNANGLGTEYYETGALKKEAMMDNGNYQGVVKYYDKNGKLAKTMYYYYGKLISVKNE
jgi:antitoxin component YwqK of YwqJK toxin-antitoxin module